MKESISTFPEEKANCRMCEMSMALIREGMSLEKTGRLYLHRQFPPTDRLEKNTEQKIKICSLFTVHDVANLRDPSHPHYP